MKKIVSFFILLFIACESFSQVVYFKESFDSSWTLPGTLFPAWSCEQTGDNEWHRVDYYGNWTDPEYGEYYPYGANGSQFSARFHTYGSFFGEIGELVSPSIVISNPSQIKLLSFYYINPDYDSDSLFVQFSTNNGVSWEPVVLGLGNTTGWVRHVINIGNIASNSFKVKFTALSDYGYSDIGIDEVVIKDIPVPLTGVKTISTSGGDYLSLSEAIQALNDAGVGAGGVVFNISSGYVKEESLPALNISGSSLNPIVIKKIGSGENPRILIPEDVNGNKTAVLNINGCSYLTVEGIDFINRYNNNNVKRGIEITNISGSIGSGNNVFKKCRIVLPNSKDCIGIYQYHSFLPLNIDGSNSNNKFYNIIIDSANVGIKLIGSSSFNDIGNEINTSNNEKNYLTGNVSMNGISGKAEGINCSYQKNVTVKNCIISKYISGGDVNGIYIGYCSGTNIVSKNIIKSLRCTYPSIGYNVSGINFDVTENLENTVSNNFISDLNHENEFPATDVIGRGIAINMLGSSGSVNVFNNSVLLTMQPGASNSLIYSKKGSLKLINNNLVNRSLPNSSTKRYCVRIDNGSIISNYNNFFINSHSTNFYGRYLGVDKKTFLNWKASVTPNFDTNSVSENPLFNSVEDLHIQTVQPSLLESNGLSISSVPVDIDDESRNVKPDIGADEFIGQSFNTNSIVVNLVPLSNDTLSRRVLDVEIKDSLYGIPVSGIALPVLYWKTNRTIYKPCTSIYLSNSIYRFSFGDSINLGDSVFYYICAQNNNRTAFKCYPSLNYGGISYNPPSVAYPPSNPLFFLRNGYPLSGKYAVGLSYFIEKTGLNIKYKSISNIKNNTSKEGADIELFPELNGKRYTEKLYKEFSNNNANEFKGVYANLTTAVSDLNKFGVNGPVQFILMDTLYSNYCGEVYPITFLKNNNYPTSVENNVLIKPNVNQFPLLFNNFGNDMLVIKGFSNLKIDGSNTSGGKSRDLTFNGEGPNRRCIHLLSSADSLVVNNIQIENCNINEGDIYGGGKDLGNNGKRISNIIIKNNYFKDCGYSVYFLGNGVNKISGVEIVDNLSTDRQSGWVNSGHIYLEYVDGFIIENNSLLGKNIETSWDFSGIHLDSGVSNGIVSKNIIRGYKSKGERIMGIRVRTMNDGNNKIINNFIYDIIGTDYQTTYGCYGIFLESGVNNKVFNNSINLFGNRSFCSTCNSVSAALLVTGGSGYEIKNNIFKNTQIDTVTGAKSYSVYATVPVSAFSSIDNNIYYVEGAQGILGYLGGNKYTFDEWKLATQMDLNSYSSDPMFISDSNIHINNSEPSAAGGSGFSISGIEKDIDNENRLNPPDIGADEFDYTTLNPRNFIVSKIQDSTVKLLFNRNTNGDSVIIFYNSLNNFTIPVNGVQYSVGEIVQGGNKVVYKGIDSIFYHNIVSPSQSFHYKAYSFSANNYVYSTGVYSSCSNFSVENPNAISAKYIAVDSNYLSWTKNSSNNDVLIIHDSLTSLINYWRPVDGSVYNVGDLLTPRGRVIYKGNLNSFVHSGINCKISNYYKIFSFNSLNNYSSGVPFDNVSHNSIVNPDSIKYSDLGVNGALISWKKNNSNDNVLVLFDSSKAVNYTPVNGHFYPVDSALGSGCKVVYNGPDSAFQHSSLLLGKDYYYKIFTNNKNFYSYGSLLKVRLFSSNNSYPISESFEDGLVPVNWIGNFAIYNNHGINNNGYSFSRYLTSTQTSGYFVTKLIGPINSNSKLSFYYRLVNWSGYPSTGASFDSPNAVYIRISTNGGANYVTFDTIKKSNHIVSTNYKNKTYDLAQYNGKIINISFEVIRSTGPSIYFDVDDFSVFDSPSMAYLNSSCTQNISSVGPGQLKQHIIGIEVETVGYASPLKISKFLCNTNGSSNPYDDVIMPRIYYTGSSNSFNTSNLFGQNYYYINGPFDVSGDMFLAEGKNYFWLTYDVRPNAPSGNLIDAECNGIVINSNTLVPQIQAPVGNRVVLESLSGTYLIGLSEFNKRSGKNLFPENFQNNDNGSSKSKQEINASNSKIYSKNNSNFKVNYLENNKHYEGSYYYHLGNESDKYQDANGVYIDLYSAVDDLNRRGVSGRVDFILCDSLYRLLDYSPLRFDSIVNASNLNSINIKPQNGINVTIEGNSQSILEFNGTKFLTINGSNSISNTRNLTFKNLSSIEETSVIWFRSRDINDYFDEVCIKNCNILGNSKHTTFAGVCLADFNNDHNLAISKRISIINNKISKQKTGIYFNGQDTYSYLDSFNVIRDNDLGSDVLDDGFLNNGVYVSYQFGLKINNNNIQNVVDERPGIEIDSKQGINCYESRHVDIIGNKIHNIKSISDKPVHYGAAIGIVYSGYGATSYSRPTRYKIENNMIYQLFSNANSTGIYANSVSGIYTYLVYGDSILYNTIHLSGSNLTGNSNTKVYAASFQGAYGCVVENNIFSIDCYSAYRSNYYSLYFAEFDNNCSFDYNNYYTNISGVGNGFIVGSKILGDIKNLTDWRSLSNQDRYSISGKSGFYSDDSVFININNPDCWNINGKGLPKQTRVFDIQGNPRSNSVFNGATDIGAHEFIPSASNLPSIATVSGQIVDSSKTQFIVAGNKVAEITWFGSNLPSEVSLKYYSGENPQNPISGSKFSNVHWNISAVGGSGFSYDLELFYTPALIGTILSERSIRMARFVNNNWSIFSDSSNIFQKSVKTKNITNWADYTLCDYDSPLPVRLSYFNSEQKGNNVSLNWKTAKEENNSGFEVERKDSAGSWSKVGSVKSKGSGENIYSFSEKITKKGSYEYRLKQIDYNGNFEYFKLNKIISILAPKSIVLEQNYPNPFNSVTKISFSLPSPGLVDIVLYDISGKVVANIVSGEYFDSGIYEKSFSANLLSSGVYFYQLKYNKNNIMFKKMILIK